MPFLYSINASLALIIVTAGCVIVACGGHVLVRRTFKKTDFVQHNEVAGFILAVVGVLYAVLLAFVTVVVWEHYNLTEQRARAEVDAATDIWRLARHLPSEAGQRISDDVGRYAKSVYLDEWPGMNEQGDPRTQRAIVTLIGDVADFQARGEQQANLQGRLLDRVQVMADLRRNRIADTGTAIPNVMWVGLILGALTVACFIYLFGMAKFRVQLLMTGATAMMIGLTFGLIIELDYPFRGSVAVTPERWVTLSESIVKER